MELSGLRQGIIGCKALYGPHDSISFLLSTGETRNALNGNNYIFLSFYISIYETAVPSYLVDIPESDFPARLIISLLSTVRGRVQEELGGLKERT
ncbi:MAG: hypothetical protein PHR06_09500 [Candidatus Cloacimonetes bacterium]|nr:hypothetical protein [Candidatus Cloacimonadota bacterium]